MTPYEVAKQELGVKEVTGGECKRILEYHDCTTLDACEDEVPWCSAFVNWCYKQAGCAYTKLANARSWLSYGEQLKQPFEGCLVILRRGGSFTSGHVGFFVKQEGDRIQVLGGNQSDQVKYSWFPVKDVIEYRG